MKKILCALLVFAMSICLFACEPPADKEDIFTKSEGVMTWEQFNAAEMETEVTIEAYVQGKQSWWADKARFYLQDGVGGYFVYDMACSEEEYDKLAVGTKVRISGVKTAWSDEVEIVDATFEILEGHYVADPVDVTAKLGTDEIVNYQNMKVSFSHLTFVKAEYVNGEPGPDNDIYVTVGYNGETYEFCVESYLTGPGTTAYDIFATLEPGAHINVEGFLYWYWGVNTHITNVTAHTH